MSRKPTGGSDICVWAGQTRMSALLNLHLKSGCYIYRTSCAGNAIIAHNIAVIMLTCRVITPPCVFDKIVIYAVETPRRGVSSVKARI